MTTLTRAVNERTRRVDRRLWLALVGAIGLLIIAPVAAIVLRALTPEPGTWQHLWETRLPEMMGTTVVLLVTVAVGTLVLGAGTAWLVTAYAFPGRRLLGVLLVLPLAMPSYVLGFVFLGLFDFAGPVQTTLRRVAGPAVWFPEIRSIGGAALVLSLALYPYVYVLARTALREQAGTTLDAARVLGVSPLRAAWRVVLPLARPSLAAGLALVMMETLTDFATVQYFNVQTISVGVYRVWRGMFDRAAATQLAALVLLFALAVLLVERALRGRARFYQPGARRDEIEPTPLSGWRAWLATGTCGAVVAIAFGVPVVQLVAWSDIVSGDGLGRLFDARFFSFLQHSFLLAAVAAVSVVTVGLLVSHGVRLSANPVARRAVHLVTIGYAVPGPVVAIGVLLVFAALDAVGVPGARALATGSIIGVVYAYLVRFQAVGYSSVDASLEKVSPSVTMSALSLGAAPHRVLRRLHLPLARAGIGAGLALVAIDALKELPIVLLVRPFGFDTLSVWVWQLAGESRWEEAALPALVIVAAAAVPVLLLFRNQRSPREIVPAEVMGR